jgi:hypothetical protein
VGCRSIIPGTSDRDKSRRIFRYRQWQEELVFKATWGKVVRPYPKSKNKMDGSVAQVVEYLPSNHKVINSISSTEKKKGKKKM